MTLWTPRRCRFPMLLRVGRPIREEDHCNEQAVTHIEVTMNDQRVGLDVCKRHEDQIKADGGIATRIIVDDRPN